MSEPLDPAAIMAAHQGHEALGGGMCRAARINVPWPIEPCLPYRLAEKVVDLRASLGKVASAYLGLLLEQKFEDGTPVLEVAFAMDPELRRRFLALFG